MQGPGWGQGGEQQRQWAEWQAWHSQQQQQAPSYGHYDNGLPWQQSGAPPLPFEQQAEPSSRPPPAKLQRLEQLDQHMLFLHSAGGTPHRQNGAARPLAARALSGSKATRRATNSAAAASVADLPSSAAGDYLNAYPAVKRLVQRFK